jgi:hypothetical protein
MHAAEAVMNTSEQGAFRGIVKRAPGDFYYTIYNIQLFKIKSFAIAFKKNVKTTC